MGIKLRLAERMSRLGTETAFEVLARARALEAAGREIIHLEIGEPDFDTPEFIRRAAQKAMDASFTHYTPAAGLPEVRKAVAEHLSMKLGVPFKPENIVITPGAKPIMFLSILALIETGDEVIYPNPGFPIYESAVNFAGGRAVPYPLEEADGFKMGGEQLKRLITDKTRMLILNSPHNPTGAVLGRKELEEIYEVIKSRQDIWVLSDEIYSRGLYGGLHISISSFPGMPERTIVLDGMSKAYAMTGWRLGFGAMPEALAQAVTKLAINDFSCTSAFGQKAMEAALSGPQEEVEKMVAEFKVRRDLIVSGLRRIPRLSVTEPEGAFYVFPSIKAFGKSSKEMADYLLEGAGVACLSGTAFGCYGEGYIRFSYANSQKNIRLALEKIKTALEKL
ncbi:MAG: pyridoxal phosphate-dependent aminotransferase [candidate division Zixibacteria bacterium]|nr:pyridoxal phosphate-dependent aminotransferase [candidate division Zixibacteria bacterium]MCI0596514.1 pyridoxal phosphate-dependent aminotransferase [candidate division Zixibacteria bacterium]